MYQIRAATRPETLPVLPSPHHLIMILSKLGMAGPCIAIILPLRTQNTQRVAWLYSHMDTPILPNQILTQSNNKELTMDPYPDQRSTENLLALRKEDQRNRVTKPASKTYRWEPTVITTHSCPPKTIMPEKPQPGAWYFFTLHCHQKEYFK